ncbi:MAG: response regulator [Cellulosilyticum sp.]|nr:response regulator [Cellulosilyticum sp.]
MKFSKDMALTGIYDVIILDRMLPNKEGVEILKNIRREQINSAVIFLTAKDSVAQKIEGLDAGADDYLIKPFAKEELLARIRALGRRKENIMDHT